MAFGPQTTPAGGGRQNLAQKQGLLNNADRQIMTMFSGLFKLAFNTQDNKKFFICVRVLAYLFTIMLATFALLAVIGINREITGLREMERDFLRVNATAYDNVNYQVVRDAWIAMYEVKYAAGITATTALIDSRLAMISQLNDHFLVSMMAGVSWTFVAFLAVAIAIFAVQHFPSVDVQATGVLHAVSRVVRAWLLPLAIATFVLYFFHHTTFQSPVSDFTPDEALKYYDQFVIANTTNTYPYYVRIPYVADELSEYYNISLELIPGTGSPAIPTGVKYADDATDFFYIPLLNEMYEHVAHSNVTITDVNSTELDYMPRSIAEKIHTSKTAYATHKIMAFIILVVFFSHAFSVLLDVVGEELQQTNVTDHTVDAAKKGGSVNTKFNDVASVIHSEKPFKS